MWAELGRWQGVVLVAMVSSSTLWLSATDQLGLYVAPRHVGFAVAMAAVGLAAVLASIVRGRGHHDEHASAWAQMLSRSGTILALLVAGTLLVLPPATLSSATASQRDINSTAVGGRLGDEDRAVQDAAAKPDAAFAGFSVFDWATLLRQTSDPSFYDGKPVDVVGFITADAEDPENMFYVSRFLITHCAIDAQPVGVPVYLENWKSSFEPDQWVRASGALVANRSADSGQQIALLPRDIARVDQPSDPYLY
ncbi:MAG TPA: TIGR03943 family protein [Marisediminicola sp.]|jgi:uncharacterized repeat protein (TIGR03943 family)|nr:TIGR03943 family protein [Marisediminicola sp.]